LTIAVTAPQKFDYQDLACVKLMLRFWGVCGTQFLVEPKGGEDGELIFPATTVPSRFEIQVKGSNAACGLGLVATCLAHTPARATGDTLLERLIADPSRIALLVISGRCDDGAAPFVVGHGWGGQPHADGHITATQTTALLSAFAVAAASGKNSSDLKAKRQAHNAAFAHSANVVTVRSALHRLVILEQLDEAELVSRCAERLRRDHRIPDDRIDDVLHRLRAAVKTAKGQGTDAYPLVRAVLLDATPAPLLPAGYVDRGIEAELVERLSRDRVLLLSGTPRVGKSFTARRVAADFGPHGYDLQEFSDIDAAERFLLEPTSAFRLALLDDPLGSVQVASDATRSLGRIERLIGRLPVDRRLVVAQGAEPLMATARAPTLDEIKTGGHHWMDLSALPPKFVVAIWASFCAYFGVPDQLARFVRDQLGAGTLVLEPGCLEYLAANHQHVSAPPKIDAVTRVARMDASALGRALADDGYERLLTRLALTTSATEPIRFPELAFVGGAGGDSLPSRSSNRWTTMTIGEPPPPVAPAPSYERTPELKTTERDALEALERRRLLSIDTEPAVNLTHPFYRAAAESLLDAPTQNIAVSAVNALGRGLFCLSPTTSRATARNLDWAFDKLTSRSEARSALLDHAVDGLRSFYPATRDLCFRFLVRRLGDLPAKMRHDLPTWVSRVTSVRLSDLEWTDGHAHLPYGEHLGTDYFARLLSDVGRQDVATELALLDAGGGLVSPERAARALGFLKHEPAAMTASMMGRLLSYDEAAIRAEAARVWLVVQRSDDNEILDRVFADDHPSSAVAAYKGVLDGWGGLAPERQGRLLDGLATIASDAAAAAALMERLVLFNRVEETGATRPWPVFERLLPVVMAVLPHNAAFIDARLFAVARSALGALPAAAIVSLCDRWIDWLERNEQEGCLQSDASLGVADILLSATVDRPQLRMGRVARLLAFRGTGATIRYIADLVDHWDALTIDEQSIVLERIAVDRSDRAWLRGTALTRGAVPSTVQVAILGPTLDLSAGAEALVGGAPLDLLSAALHVYSGEPQPLWWLGLHHSGKPVWEPVIEQLARMPDHPLFEVAFEETARDGDGPRVARVVMDVGAAHAERMLDVLLRLKVRCNGWFMPEAWAALLALAPDSEAHGRWLDRMAAAAPAILDDLSDLTAWLTEERDLRLMLDRLKRDLVLLKMVRTSLDRPGGVDASELQANLLPVLKALVDEQTPLLFGTCNRLLNKLKGVDAPDLQAALRGRREEILNEKDHIEASMKRADWLRPGWIDP